MSDELHAARRKRAYEAFDAGDLATASPLFTALARERGDDSGLHYMAGLAAKYRGDWADALAANLAALALEDDEAARWNAAIAATGLGDWTQARSQWHALGIRIPGEQGPIEGNFGRVKLRLHPWSGSEGVYGQRLCPVRVRIENVPLPQSGHRFGDVVLNDGASVGTHAHGDHRYLVMNELDRIEASPYATYTVFVQARDAASLDLLLHAEADGIGLVEDWSTLRTLCLRCSHGVPHTHDEAAQAADAAPAWRRERTLGIAATSRAAVEALLDRWSSRFRGRRVESIEQREHPVPPRLETRAWWRAPDDEDDNQQREA